MRVSGAGTHSPVCTDPPKLECSRRWYEISGRGRRTKGMRIHLHTGDQHSQTNLHQEGPPPRTSRRGSRRMDPDTPLSSGPGVFANDHSPSVTGNRAPTFLLPERGLGDTTQFSLSFLRTVIQGVTALRVRERGKGGLQPMAISASESPRPLFLPVIPLI